MIETELVDVVIGVDVIMMDPDPLGPALDGT